MKLSTVFTGQGIYYLITGAWPILSIDTFMQVTGPKTDVWLVKMVGLLTIAIAVTLLSSARKDPQRFIALAVCAALSYLIVDVYYVINKTIDEIYLGDAAAELAIVLLIVFRSNNHDPRNDFFTGRRK